jgi:hypothetical protein
MGSGRYRFEDDGLVRQVFSDNVEREIRKTGEQFVIKRSNSRASAVGFCRREIAPFAVRRERCDQGVQLVPKFRLDMLLDDALSRRPLCCVHFASRK